MVVDVVVMEIFFVKNKNWCKLVGGDIKGKMLSKKVFKVKIMYINVKFGD